MSEIKRLDLKFNEELIPMDYPRQIIIHHTHNPSLTTESTHQLHIERFKWAGIGYNYFVEKDGSVFEGRGMYIGAHAKGHNKDSIGIALSGNFDESVPNDDQMEALLKLTLEFMYKYDIEPNRVLGHRELDDVEKSCPGVLFDMDKFRDRMLRRINRNHM